MTVFPEDVNMLQPFIDAAALVALTLNEVWQDVKHIVNQKEFALSVVPHGGIATLLFNMKKGLTASEAFDKLTTNAKYNLITSYLK